MSEAVLPQGWLKAKLIEVAQPRGEKVSPSDYAESQFIGMDHVEAQTTKIIGSVSAGTMKSNAARFYSGDVLYGRLRPYLNKVAQPSFDGLASAEFIVFPDGELIKAKFLKYRLNARDFVSFAGHLNEGDRPRVSFDQIGDFEILVPPPPEQHRIVAKIEELFSELDKGIEALKTAREQLKVYRQALLKHAFEGKLTAQWREQHRDQLEPAADLLARIQTEREQRYQQQLRQWQTTGGSLVQRSGKPKVLKSLPPLTAEELAELPELPEGWGWVKLGDLALKITDGEHFKPPVRAEGVYFLSAKDVRDDGVTFDDPLFIDQETAEKARSRCDPERNDILVVSRGATVGRMCIVNTDKLFCLLGSVILIKANGAVESSYFLSALKSPFVNKRIVGVSGATAQQAIYLRDIQHVPVPVCSLVEQYQIVEELESKLSEADQLELTLTAALQQAEALRQSILKRAFSGKLVPQDPNDQPASELLARIKAENMRHAEKSKKSISRGKRNE